MLLWCFLQLRRISFRAIEPVVNKKKSRDVYLYESILPHSLHSTQLICWQFFYFHQVRIRNLQCVFEGVICIKLLPRKLRVSFLDAEIPSFRSR